MKNETPTAYQRSIIDESSNRSVKQNVVRFISTLSVTLVATGFLLRFNDVLPQFVDGWLVFLAAGYIVLNWFFAGVGLIIWGGLAVMRTMLEKGTEESKVQFSVEWPGNAQDTKFQVEKIQYKVRSTVVGFAKKSKMLSSLKFSLGSVLDTAADLYLFAALVTVNHPYMAMFHGVSVVLQHFFLKRAKRNLYAAILTLADPLEESGKTDIDDLMDKLCEPDSKDNQDSK